MTILSLIGKKKGNPTGSLDHMAWQRFRRNPLSVASLVVIGLFAVVALLG